jgi:hypothetical protein
VIVKIFQIGGSFEYNDGFEDHGGEFVFFNLIFVKSKLKYRLTTRFDLVVKQIVHDYYSLYMFPFGDATNDYQDKKLKYVLEA